VPVNDPLLVVPGMAAVSEHLGFGVTAITSFEPPYSFARWMSTLDHLTSGRIIWNIVSGYLDSAAKAMGQPGQAAHDTRYDMAEEYMEVVYKLWEGSWEDDAVRRDRATGIFTDPAKVHPVTHHGAYYHMEGIHLSAPSPQRTPVLFQAGASAKGQRFAASHSECVFVAGGDREALKSSVARLREEVASQGRQPADVIVFAMMTVIVGETDAAAQRKLQDYQSYVSAEGTLALMSGWSGIDYSRPPEAVSRPGNAIQGAAGGSTITDPRAAVERTGLAGSSPVIVGSPSRVADELETWMNETGIDGFNLTRQVMPETFVDFVDLAVPELQRRGVYKRNYAPGTLREKLFGKGPRLQAPHPGVRFRWGAQHSQLQAAE
jgi:FMN-dependent oxidoreductase (nitrilotriacetate monooxygenase family)